MKTPQNSLSATMLLLAASAGAMTTSTMADTFGTGANSFTMDFVTIGNPGNASDPGGAPGPGGVPIPAGSVSYTYRIGTYEVNADMMSKANTLGGLNIPFHDVGANNPASLITWNMAARFVNWMNTSSGYSVAYKFDTQPGDVNYNPNEYSSFWGVGDSGYNPTNRDRNSNAHYFLPSSDEWYKAAYYNPATSSYFKYATGSDLPPTPVAGGTAPGTAVWYNTFVSAEVNNAGGLSPYGTMAQSGNVKEWIETYVFSNTQHGYRSFRGGSMNTYPESIGDLSSSEWEIDNAVQSGPQIGFRVTAVPEPEQYAAVFGGALLGTGVWLRRKKV